MPVRTCDGTTHQVVLDAKAWSDRPGLQMGVDVVEGDVDGCTEEPGLLLLVATPPSTIRSTPFMMVLVKPAVALAPCWLP
jgi:hypothetical protein